MADRTVRAIFDAKVDGAKKGLTSLGKGAEDAGKKVDGLAKDLKTLDGQKVDPDIDLQIDDAKKRLSDLTAELSDLKGMEASPEVDLQIERVKGQIGDVRSEIKSLTSQKYEVRVDAAIKEAQGRVQDLTRELGDLRTMKASPEVDVQIREAQSRLRDAKREVRELDAAKASIKVDADTGAATSALQGVADEAAAAGAEGGEEAGSNLVSGIVGALKSIPIAGAVVGVGAAIGFALVKGIKDGLQIEANADFFSAQTGLSGDTAAKFGRAAGEAYAQGFGDSIAENMSTARTALEQGLIDPGAVEADVSRVISSLSGVARIMEADIGEAARAAGQMIKTGLVENSQEAFDVLVSGFQNGADASWDLLDTFTEYSTFFRDLGLNGSEAMGLLVQGLDKGAFNADKAADALKELRIKVNDLSAAEGLAELGIDIQKVRDAFAEGGPAARDALEEIFTALQKVEDPATRAGIAVGLFGTQAEDLGKAVEGFDLSNLPKEFQNVEGAASDAINKMMDNAAQDIENAKRDIEVALNGVKGALAAAFGDDISAAAEWVSRNRAPMMEFFISVVDAALTMGEGIVEGVAIGLSALGEMAETAGKVASALGMTELGVKLLAVGDSAQEAAGRLQTEFTTAVDAVRSKMESWAGPQLMAARVHDATMAMSEDMAAFSAYVNESGGTVKINGETVNAEQALQVLIGNINGEDGTVTINGNKVPADQALAVLMGEIGLSTGSVKINGNTVPAEQALAAVLTAIDDGEEFVKINGNKVPAEQALAALMSVIADAREDVKIGGDDSEGRRETGGLVNWIRTQGGEVKVSADTWQAQQEINLLTRPRSMTLSVRVAGVNSVGGMLRHDGGWIAPGLNAGGFVPGSDPGYDNVLWPLNSGGRTLQQPLTGGEYVVNSGDARFWGPMLEWMNSGGRPGGGASPSLTGLEIVGTLDTPDGTARIRGIVRGELTAQARSARTQRSVR